MPLYTVRVRGIYATALAALALEKGYLLSDLSKVLLQRIDVPTSSKPPNITVKHGDESLDEVLIHAFPYEAGAAFERDVLEAVGHAAVRKPPLPLRSIVDARVVEGCRAEGPGGVAIVIVGMEDCPEPGTLVRLTVARSPPGDGAVEGMPVIEVVGLTARVAYPSSGLVMSRHIKGHDASRLLDAVVSSGVDTGRFRVRIRSGARLASEGDVASEIRELAAKAERLYEEGPSGEVRIVEKGEFVSLVYLPSTAKSVMDGLRRRLYPTVNMHHSLKSWGGEREGLLVDYAEEGMKRGMWGPESGDIAVEFILSRLERSRLFIEHRKPDGETTRIGPFRVASYKPGPPGELVLERVFRSRGLYDGLGVERSPGDRGVTRVLLGEWVTIHEYYTREGRLLGVYANINTPPEPGFDAVKYLDLSIDVVKKPGEPPKVVDRDELKMHCRRGALTEVLCREAERQASRAAGLLSSRYP